MVTSSELVCMICLCCSELIWVPRRLAFATRWAFYPIQESLSKLHMIPIVTYIAHNTYHLISKKSMKFALPRKTKEANEIVQEAHEFRSPLQQPFFRSPETRRMQQSLQGHRKGSCPYLSQLFAFITVCLHCCRCEMTWIPNGGYDLGTPPMGLTRLSCSWEQNVVER